MTVITPITVDQQHKIALQTRRQEQIELRLALASLRRKWNGT